MITVAEATNIILSNAVNWGIEQIPIQNSTGRILREEIRADRDFPPFDRVTMDGIAIHSRDIAKGLRNFKVIGMQTAGEPAQSLDGEGTAIEIMTGAIKPANADTVIKYEDVEIVRNGSESTAKLLNLSVNPGQNVHIAGSDRQEGDLLIDAGWQISPAEVGVLATVGKEQVQVSKHPRIAIVSTGNELVPLNETPLPHQIRMSNSYTLKSHLNALGIKSDIFHLKDDKELLVSEISDILSNHDVLLLSGGVSKGKTDYIPEVLDHLGVSKLFHRVAQRPGKPFWFGVHGSNKSVFALPGNPVSTYMCFVRYFIPWLHKSLGLEKHKVDAVLTEEFNFAPLMTYFLQVKAVYSSDGVFIAIPEQGAGSGDLSNMIESNAFLELPADKQTFKAGEIFPVYQFKTF